MRNVITRTFQSKIDAFAESLSGARSNLLRAGQLLVEMLDENENTFELLISQKLANLPMLETLERVGRGQLDPALLTDVSYAAQRAISQALPAKDQKRILTGYIPVAVKDNGGGFRIEQKRAGDLTAREAVVAIGDGTIRQPDAQIELQKQKDMDRQARSYRYEIRNDRIIFHQEASFTWAELTELAEKIKPKAVDIQASIQQRRIAK